MKYSRIKKSIVVWSIALNFIFSPLGVRGEPDETLENSNQNLIEAPGAVLMEKVTGTVIYSRDPDTEKNPASITKIMTLILIFDAIRVAGCIWMIRSRQALMRNPWAVPRYIWKKGKHKKQKP